jgi:hypothetical protein
VQLHHFQGTSKKPPRGGFSIPTKLTVNEKSHSDKWL